MPQQDLSRLDKAAQQLLEQGDLNGAKRLYTKICELDGTSAGSWFTLGSINGELGGIEEALSCLRRALELDPDFSAAHYNLGNILRAQGKLDDALHHFKEAARIEPDNLGAWLMMGGIYGMKGRLADAEECSRTAVKLQPDSVDARMNLGNALAFQGKLQEAVKNFERVTHLQPNMPLAWFMLGEVNKQLFLWNEARAAYEKAIDIKPNYTEAHFGLASVHQSQGRYLDAIKHYETAARINPQYTQAYHGLGIGLIQLGRQKEAVEVFQRVLQIKPDYAEAHAGLAAALMPLGYSNEALKSCERALEIMPGYPDAISLAATIEQQSGQLERARERLRPLVEQGIRNVNVALAYGHVCKSLDEPESAVRVLEDILNDSRGCATADMRNLHFSLGELYDAMAMYDKAFPHYRSGNMLRSLEFDPGEHFDYVTSIIDIHSKEFMASAPRASIRSSGRPLFIIGMPRSGTSLVEQVLASHPSVFAAGELPDIAEIVGALSAMVSPPSVYPLCVPKLTEETADALCRRYLDRLSVLNRDAHRVINKMPDNFLYLGLIELLFPDAKVVHCVRDPLDTCLSCYFQDFSLAHPYSYDLQNLAEYYKTYVRLMEHWKGVLNMPIMNIKYEDFVRNQEDTSKQLVEFCNLEWDERCLRFYETERFVGTASYNQVRRPVYQHSLGRWKKYEKHIGALRAALES